MYAHLTTYLVIGRAALRGPTSFRRTLILLVAGALHAFLFTLVSVCRLLDRFFYRGIVDVPVTEPVFVVATPRSGTTFLHHLLALDENSFTHQKLYQTVFPSILMSRLVDLLAPRKSDEKIVPAGATQGLFQRLFRHWEGIHSVSLSAEEEDESLFVYMLHSPAFYLLMPFIDLAPQFQDLDSESEHVRVRISACYRSTAQRHLYATRAHLPGQTKTLLVKNVLLPARLKVTKQAFPDARFVRLVRDPRDAIPSAMSLFSTTWDVHSPDIARDSHQTRCLGEMFVAHYRKLHEESLGENGSRVLTIRFEDLIQDPEAQVRKIYAFLHKPLSPEYAQKLRFACQEPQKFKSEHSYSLSDFGWSEEDVTEPLADLLDELGYGPERDARNLN